VSDIIATPSTDDVLIKRCKACGKELSVTFFYKSSKTKDRLQSYCKKCSHESVGAYSRANPAAIQTSAMVSGARKRAKAKHLDFNIDNEYVRSLIVTHCPVLKIPLEWSTLRENGSSPLANSPSLDRIDPLKGYVKGNVWIISNKANMIKNNATHEELKLVTKAVGEAIVKSLEF
jgi:hypothetical protein